jgi:membrane-associated phospholipid phosphatase
MMKLQEKKASVLSFMEKNKHGLLLLYFLIYLPWFHYLEKTVTTHFHVIHVALDDYIPFCEYFIIPYFLWFGYIAWGLLYFYFKNKDEYFRLCAVLFTGMTVFLVVSTIYPNGHYLRPTAFARDNIFVHLVQMLYAADTSTNLFPSIHVYNSIAINFAVWHCDNFRNNRLVRYGSAVLAGSIILSTMFLKQHSVFDVATGILMAVFMLSVVYRPNALKIPERESKYERKLHRVS